MARITLDDIKTTIAADGWSVVSDSYKSLDTEMEFVCDEGHHVFSTWKKIRAKRECPACKQKSNAIQTANIPPKPRGATRILALDQATKVTGYAVFDNGQLIKYGTYEAPNGEEIDRLAAVRDWVTSMVTNLKPNYVGLEGIQYQDSSTSSGKMGVTVFQTLAHLQGILMLACYDAKVPFALCPTNTWRNKCGVKGRSRVDRKRSMQLLVKEWYDVSVSEDEADAIGIGAYLVNNVWPSAQVVDWE